MKRDRIPWAKEARVFQCVWMVTECKRRWDHSSWTSNIELGIGLEILLLLGLLEQRGWKDLLSKVLSMMLLFLCVLGGVKSAAGKRIFQVCAGIERF